MGQQGTEPSAEDRLYKALEESSYSAEALDKLNKYYGDNFDWQQGNLQDLLIKRSAAFATAAGGQWRQRDWLSAIGNGAVAALDAFGAVITGKTWEDTAQNTVKGIATGGALGVLGAASKAAGAQADFVPATQVSMHSQAGWRAISMGDLSAAELELTRDVMNASEIMLGRSTNVKGRGGLVLDTWLENKYGPNAWSQQWQDVYNRALYERTSAGKPVDVMAGGGYSRSEVIAAEAGARVSGIQNRVYWPKK